MQGRVHELTELHPGQLLQLVYIEHPTGGTPAWVEALAPLQEAEMAARSGRLNVTLSHVDEHAILAARKLEDRRLLLG